MRDESTNEKKVSNLKIIVLVTLAVFTYAILQFPQLIETYYSQLLFPALARTMRALTGSFPFSIGDVMYACVILWLLIAFYKWVVKLAQQQLTLAGGWQLALRWFRRLTLLWIWFQWLWAFNYNRMGSAYQLNLVPPGQFDSAKVIRLYDTIEQRLSTIVPQLSSADTNAWYNKNELQQKTVAAYKLAATKYPFLQYRNASIKTSLYSNLGGYMGFSGYFNPFSGEAQVDGGIPPFNLPYVMCHEVGHQLGYAAEEEANLVGYLAAKQGSSAGLRYSAYHDMLMYTASQMFRMDSALLKEKWEHVPELVKQHEKQARQYYRRHRNPLQAVINRWYDLYLKWNNQEKGIQSYSYVTAWLIAYAEKYGWDKL